MNIATLISEFPRLWHMAEDGSWPSIQQHGLLSTSALLKHYEVAKPQRALLESRRRPESVEISRKGLPNAVIRDQKPLHEEKLRACLEDGVSPEDWYRILNARTFFWVSRERLIRLLNARAYRNKPHTILTVDTASLVTAHLKRIELCPINSGATLFTPPKRGLLTFRPISEYPYEELRRTKGRSGALAEFVVKEGVPDVADHVIKVHRVDNGQYQSLWTRPGEPAGSGI